MTKSLKLIFFGNERLVSGLEHTNAPVLRGLIAAGYDVCAIVSHYSAGRSRKSRPLEVAEIAEAYSIPLYLPDRPSDIIETLQSYDATAAVLVAYGKIIPQRVINVFNPIGIINLHPSLLPRHRGPTPIETTLSEGDTTAGVSIMQLTAGMDEGPVYAQASVSLNGLESKQELFESLSTRGTELLLSQLPAILSGSLQPTPQVEEAATYTSLFNKSDGLLVPDADSAETIERKIRAYQGYPKARLPINGVEIIIVSATVVAQADPAKLTIPCSQSTLLEITELIAPSGKKMSGEAFLRGYHR